MSRATVGRHVAVPALEWLWYLLTTTLWVVGSLLLVLATDLPAWAVYLLVAPGALLFAQLFTRRPSDGA